MNKLYVVKGFIKNGSFTSSPIADEAEDYLKCCAVWKEEGLYEGYKDVSTDVETCPKVQYAFDLVYPNGPRYVSLIIVAGSEKEAEKIARNLSSNRGI